MKSSSSERTNGYKEFKKHILANYPPQEVAEITGIDVKELYNLAKIYARADASCLHGRWE